MLTEQLLHGHTDRAVYNGIICMKPSVPQALKSTRHTADNVNSNLQKSKYTTLCSVARENGQTRSVKTIKRDLRNRNQGIRNSSQSPLQIDLSGSQRKLNLCLNYGKPTLARKMPILE